MSEAELARLRAIVASLNAEHGWGLGKGALSSLVDGVSAYLTPLSEVPEDLIRRVVVNYHRDGRTVQLLLDPEHTPEQDKIGAELTDYLVRVACKVFHVPLEKGKEIVQEAWVDALRGLPGFRFRSRLTTWLHSVLIRRGLLLLRKDEEKQEIPVSLEQDDPAEASRVESLEDLGPPPDLVVQREQVAERLHDVLREELERISSEMRSGQIPREHKRRVAELFFLESCDPQEIARELGLNPQTVRTIIHRVRRKLQERKEVHKLLERWLGLTNGAK